VNSLPVLCLLSILLAFLKTIAFKGCVCLTFIFYGDVPEKLASVEIMARGAA
jgi:hypothetical protein